MNCDTTFMLVEWQATAASLGLAVVAGTLFGWLIARIKWK